MSFVFYDTETTGTNTTFDQILQFGAIKTDHDLNEIDRFLDLLRTAQTYIERIRSKNKILRSFSVDVVHATLPEACAVRLVSHLIEAQLRSMEVPWTTMFMRSVGENYVPVAWPRSEDSGRNEGQYRKKVLVAYRDRKHEEPVSIDEACLPGFMHFGSDAEASAPEGVFLE